jgi:hypothetical protein
MAERPFSARDLDMRDVVISRSQMRDFSLFERLDTEARRRGIPLQILSDAAYEELMNTSKQVDEAPPNPVTRSSPAPTPPGVHRRSDGSRVMVISRDDARDIGLYEQRLAEAKELGMDVQIAPKTNDAA